MGLTPSQLPLFSHVPAPLFLPPQGPALSGTFSGTAISSWSPTFDSAKLAVCASFSNHHLASVCIPPNHQVLTEKTNADALLSTYNHTAASGHGSARGQKSL